MVSLFNLEDDPQEVTNLAKLHPSLVEELLEEAEEAIKDAPKMFRGDMVHVEAPVSPQHNWFATIRNLGTNYDEIIPFGAYINDNEDITNLNYVRTLGKGVYLGLFSIVIKILTVFIVFPISLITIIFRLFSYVIKK